MSFRSSRSSELLFTKTNRSDRFKQMTKQQQLIEEKKRQIQEKLEEQKRKEAEEALKKIQTDTKAGKKWKYNTRRSPELEDTSQRSGNIFTNDGSFLDQFRKLSGVEASDSSKSSSKSEKDSPSRKRRDGERRRDRSRERSRSPERRRYRDNSPNRRNSRREEKSSDRWSDKRDRSRSPSRSTSSESQSSSQSDFNQSFLNDPPSSLPNISTEMKSGFLNVTQMSSVNPYSIPPPSPLIPQSIPPPNPLPPQNIPPPSPLVPQSIPPPRPLAPQNIPAPMVPPNMSTLPRPPMAMPDGSITDPNLSLAPPPLGVQHLQLQSNIMLQSVSPVNVHPPLIMQTPFSIPPPQTHVMSTPSPDSFVNTVNLNQPPPPLPGCNPVSNSENATARPQPLANFSDISPSMTAPHSQLTCRVPADINQASPEDDTVGLASIKQEPDFGDFNIGIKEEQIEDDDKSDLRMHLEDYDLVKMENDSERKNKSDKSGRRRSRWGEAVSSSSGSPVVPPVQQVTTSPIAATPTISVTGMSGHLISKVTRTDPGLLQYTISSYGTLNLSEEDWKKAEDNYKIHLLYQDMMKKRAEVERLHAKGKNKYEYDSDEEIDGGTWEHKAREKEMVATREWAESLTEAAKGKHHIGDFLPPEELKKFLEKYNAVKGGKQPDLSDYKEYKLKEDNKGFQMLQKLGWTEGQGLGSDGSGIVDPINKAKTRDTNQGLGSIRPDDVASGDDEYDAYRKRMMLAYRFRPNPLNNPRRPYY